jgi:molybdopterin-guanine dinucleotide biosynthesis protein A
MTAIVLAGGKSSRLGRNKALQVIGGKSLIQWVVERLATVSAEIIISTASGETVPCSSAASIETVSDEYPGKGPLAGICSGLVASSSPRAIVVGCDTPFLSTGLLEHMIRISPTFDVVIPRIKNKVEPLCAVYSKNCVAPIRQLLQQNELKIIELLPMVRMRYVEEDEVDSFDPEHLSFFNINSQADLDRATALATEKGWASTRS